MFLLINSRLVSLNPLSPPPVFSFLDRHLAHLYAAEALCILGRPAEALEHLAPVSEGTATAAAAAGAWSTSRRPSLSSSSSSSTFANNSAVTAARAAGVTGAAASGGAGGGAVTGVLPGGAGAGVSWVGIAGELTPEAAAEARASLQANLAAVHALQGNLALAERCARTAMGICPGSAAVLRMAVYVLIRQGNIAEALQVTTELKLVFRVGKGGCDLLLAFFYFIFFKLTRLTWRNGEQNKC